jgi:hypothetical protein
LRLTPRSSGRRSLVRYDDLTGARSCSTQAVPHTNLSRSDLVPWLQADPTVGAVKIPLLGRNRTFNGPLLEWTSSVARWHASIRGDRHGAASFSVMVAALQQRLAVDQAMRPPDSAVN